MLELAAFAVTIIVAVTCLYYTYLMYGAVMDALDEMRELIAHLRQNIKPAPPMKELTHGKTEAPEGKGRSQGFAGRIG